MKIKSGLNQFEKIDALLAVAGDRRAKFYLAGQGEINLVGEAEELVPKYDDKEGFFGGKKGGKVSRMGSPSAEVKKEYLFNKFAVKFAAGVKGAAAGQKNIEIFLFAPAEIKNMLAKSIPAALAGKIKMSIGGNYLHYKPFELIELVSRQSPKGKTVISDKARKLLKK